MWLKNGMSIFTELGLEEVSMSDQSFGDYKGKYMDHYDKTRRGQQKEKMSILHEVDFEINRIHMDEIKVSYFLKFLAKIEGSALEVRENRKRPA